MSGAVREAASVEAKDVRVVREPAIAGTVVLVDGLPGCGKTLMTAIVGALDRVELMQYAYEIEYACALRLLGRLAPDGAIALIKMFTDLRLYNVMMGRETNFRWDDLSGVRLNAHPWRYLARLFSSGDATVLPRIQRERPILHIATHLLLGASRPVLDALGERARFVEVVRHPLYMIKQQFAYMHRWGADPRDFTIWFDHGGRSVPWFALGWERQFLESNSMDQAIYMIEHMQRRIDGLLEGLSEEERRRVLIVPFERFVTDPWPFMRALEPFLDTQVTATTRRAMRRQNVPRRMYAEGIGLKIYRQYGWEPPAAGADERSEFERRRQLAAERASREGLAVLDRLCHEYEQKYLAGR